MVLKLTDDAIQSCCDISWCGSPKRAVFRSCGMAEGRECFHALVHLINIVGPIVGVILLCVYNTIEYHSSNAARKQGRESAADDSAVTDAIAPQFSIGWWLTGQLSLGFGKCEQIVGNCWRSHIVWMGWLGLDSIIAPLAVDRAWIILFLERCWWYIGGPCSV